MTVIREDPNARPIRPGGFLHRTIMCDGRIALPVHFGGFARKECRSRSSIEGQSLNSMGFRRGLRLQGILDLSSSCQTLGTTEAKGKAIAHPIAVQMPNGWFQVRISPLPPVLPVACHRWHRVDAS